MPHISRALFSALFLAITKRMLQRRHTLMYKLAFIDYLLPEMFIGIANSMIKRLAEEITDQDRK